MVYGTSEESICVCNKCHKLIHKIQDGKWGFVMQLLLLHYNNTDYIYREVPNLYKHCMNCKNELISELNNGAES